MANLLSTAITGSLTTTTYIGIGTASPSVPLTVIADNGGNAIRLLGRSGDGYAFTTFRNNADTATNGEIGISNAQNMLFYTGTSERMRISSYGQLLINSTSSGYGSNGYGYNLGVKGISTQAFISISRSTQTLDSEGLVIGVDTTEGAIYLRDNLPLSIYTNNTFAMRVAANGNVGIGTTAPGNKLHIKSGSSGFSGTYDSRYKSIVEHNGEAYYATYVPDNSYSGLRFNNSSGLRGFIDYYHGTQGDGFVYSAINQHIWLINGSERVRISSNGNVGIGTTSPGAKLDVGGASTPSIKITSSSGPYSVISSNTVGSLEFSADDGNTGASSNINFKLDGSDVVRINSTGVGIGTTSPQSRLDLGVASSQSTISTLGYSANAALNIRIPNSVGDVGQIVFTNDAAPTAGYASIGVVMTSGTGVGLGDMVFATKSIGGDAASTERMRINSSGNVGIGVTSIEMGLQIGDGRGLLVGPSSSSGSTYVSPIDENTINGSWGIASDNADIWLNYRGYRDGFDYFRDTRIGNGKGTAIVMVDGSAGSVGIGTTSPIRKLHNAGSYYLEGAAANYSSYTPDGLFNANANPMFLGSGGYGGTYGRGGSVGGLVLGYKDNGSGLYSPAYAFEVKSTDGIPVGGRVVQAIVMKNIDTNVEPINIYNNGSVHIQANADYDYFNIYTSYSGNRAIVQAGQTGADGFLRVKDAVGVTYSSLSGYSGTPSYFLSNVGIGTTSPGRGLTINRSNEFAALNIIKSNTTNQIVYLGTDTSGADDGGILQLYDGAVEKARVYTRGNSFFNGGNVGIGTTSPTGKLDIRSGGLDTNPLTIYGTTSGAKMFDFRDDSAGGVTAAMFRMYNASGTETVRLFPGTTTAHHSWILPTGNFGIGTTSPAANFQIGSPGANLTQDLLLVKGGGSSGNYGFRVEANNGDDLFFVDTLSYNVLVPSGKVGIGTTSLTHRLNVYDGVTNQYTVRIQSETGNGAGKWMGIGFSGESSNNKGAILFQSYGTSYSRGRMIFALNNAQDQSSAVPTDAVMSLEADGRVGIGTTSPGSNLHLSGAGATELRIASTTANTNSLLSFYEGSIASWGIDAGQANGKFYIKDLYNTNTRLTIDASGNVGIGTTSPSAKLDVSGDARTSGYVLVNNHSDNTLGYRISNTSGSNVSAMFVNSANALVIGSGVFDQVQLNKKTLINGAALGVNVAASATAGRIDASNDIVAYSSSDERLKQNITPIENALDKVKSLTGVEFDWKPEYKDAHGYEGHDTGIIAQQVQDVMPTAVRTNDTGFLAVRYEKLIGLLIEANKELAARVEELEKKLN